VIQRLHLEDQLLRHVQRAILRVVAKEVAMDALARLRRTVVAHIQTLAWRRLAALLKSRGAREAAGGGGRADLERFSAACEYGRVYRRAMTIIGKALLTSTPGPGALEI